MKFPRTITIDNCEKFLKKLGGSDDALCFPVETKASAFGGLASAIQAVNTWARLSNTAQIKLQHSRTKDVIEEVINRPHKFSASMMARSIVIDNLPAKEIRKDVNDRAKHAIEAQAKNQYGQQHGGCCWFAFVDHSSKAFDRNFYIEERGCEPSIRQLGQFNAIIKEMIEKAMRASGGAIIPIDNDLDHLGRIFYELFLNTHEHGTRKIIRSEWLKPGMRVIYAQSINLSEAGESGMTEKQPVLSEYVETIKNKLEKQGHSRFLELGIVDSGLGYRSRWEADHPIGACEKNIPIQEEYDIFRKCFNFRSTSTNRDNKGNGLPVVMNRLTKLNGFMRVRSGRLSLFRNFASKPFEGSDSCDFYDWNNNKEAGIDITEMTKVEGVAISILIPLEPKA